MTIKNESGIKPLEYKCLVLPDHVEETTIGGIVLAKSIQEQDQLAETKGVLVAIGSMAGKDWDGDKLEIGCRVMIAKYAGLLCRGKDDKEYRLVNDKDLCAVLDF